MQVHKLEGDREKENARADDMEAIKRENEELKEVLSAVQIDLEANVEVSKTFCAPVLVTGHGPRVLWKPSNCETYYRSV